MIGLNILFANDDVFTQWVMTDVLMGAGFAVASVCRAAQIMDLLADAPEFDILLLDITLPDIAEGYDIARAWRRASPGRPLIFTGPNRTTLQHALQVNESFLRSPFSAEALLRTIDMALEETCFRPAMATTPTFAQHVH